MTTSKDQLGARVPREVRQMAVDDAKARGVSLNVYIEELIVRAHSNPLGVQMVAILDPDKAESLDMYATEATIVDKPGGDQPLISNVEDDVDLDELAQQPMKPFARNCRNGTLHWKSGPGDPCKFCGGEI